MGRASYLVETGRNSNTRRKKRIHIANLCKCYERLQIRSVCHDAHSYQVMSNDRGERNWDHDLPERTILFVLYYTAYNKSTTSAQHQPPGICNIQFFHTALLLSHCGIPSASHHLTRNGESICTPASLTVNWVSYLFWEMTLLQKAS